MPRRLRISTGGIAYHVLNRAVGRGWLFRKDADFLAMERVLAETHARIPIRILSYCLMSNHWHMVLWPAEDGQLSEFMRLLTVTHVQRWHAHHGTAGTGPLYQGRFKSFPIQRDEHLLTVCRYVERNPLRANLVPCAEAWRWSSLAARNRKEQIPWLLWPGDWPARPPRNWVSWVNRAEDENEVEAVRLSVRRGRPFGSRTWQRQTSVKLGLTATLRPRGRPRVQSEKDSRPL